MKLQHWSSVRKKTSFIGIAVIFGMGEREQQCKFGLFLDGWKDGQTEEHLFLQGEKQRWAHTDLYCFRRRTYRYFPLDPKKQYQVKILSDQPVFESSRQISIVEIKVWFQKDFE